MKTLKKVSPKALQYILLGLLVTAFVYFFYNSYRLFSDYQAVKQKVIAPAVDFQPLTPQYPYLLEIDDETRFSLFTFDRDVKKKEAEAAKAASSANAKTSNNSKKQSNYQILGVVKRDRLFLVVRFQGDPKIHLFAQGNTLGKGHKIKELSPQKVIFTDNSGAQWSHKVFDMSEIKEVGFNMKDGFNDPKKTNNANKKKDTYKQKKPKKK